MNSSQGNKLEVEMGEAIELFKKDGTTAGIFYCSKCRIVHGTEEAAEFCHGERICACGKKIESIHSRQRKCGDCDNADWKEKQRQQEAERFEKAKKITEAEYRGEMVFLDDKYFCSVDEAIDYFLEEQEPEYVWACENVGVPEASAESICENLLDNMWEDADVSDLHGVDELEAAISVFNKANESINVWMPDFTMAILVAKREVTSSARPAHAPTAPAPPKSEPLG
jgi:hypothetical protein